MKRNVSVVLMCTAIMLSAVAAQAESRGEQLFNQKCAMCHRVKAKGGAIGPELTTVASRMNEGDLKAQLDNPKKRNASSSMPSFRTLSKPDMDALLGFLKTLK
jgi:cytochrome c2